MLEAIVVEAAAPAAADAAPAVVEAEQHRDGPELAQVARNANASAQNTPSDGKKRKRTK